MILPTAAGAARSVPNRVAPVQTLPHHRFPSHHHFPATSCCIPPPLSRHILLHPACHLSPRPPPTTTVIKKHPGKCPWLSYHLQLLMISPFSPFLTVRVTSAAIADKSHFGSYIKLCDFTLLFMTLQAELRLNKRIISETQAS